MGTVDEQTTIVLHGRSIDVIVLHRRDDTILVHTDSGCQQIGLSEVLSQDTVAGLLGNSVTLTAPLGVPIDVIAALVREPVPEAFLGSAWLRQHRPLIFTDGRCTVGSIDLCYRTELGVYPDDID